MEDLVAVARIARPRGLRGEVVADVLTDFPERLNELESVTVVLPDASALSLKIDELRLQNGRAIVRFACIESVEAAEELRNGEICINEDEVAELDDDEYFDWELEGCEVRDTDGNRLGTVRELMRTGAGEILVVDGPDKEYLIPFAREICVGVDIDIKLVRVDPPEGLLEF